MRFSNSHRAKKFRFKVVNLEAPASDVTFVTNMVGRFPKIHWGFRVPGFLRLSLKQAAGQPPIHAHQALVEAVRERGRLWSGASREARAIVVLLLVLVTVSLFIFFFRSGTIRMCLIRLSVKQAAEQRAIHTHPAVAGAGMERVDCVGGLDAKPMR